VIGGPGSGATNVLDALAAQAPADVLRVPSDPESLWDAVAAMSESPPRRGTLVLIDDLDTLPLRLAPDHAQAVFERLEELLRRAGDAGILIVGTAHRVTGAVSRLADLFPRRLLLPLATRADHLAAGGDGAAFDPAAPPGRGRLDGTLVQVARAASAGSVPSRAPTPWAPQARLTGLATRRSPAARAAVAAWRGTGARVATLDEYAADPSIGAQARVVLVGEPDDWQRHWRLLADVRGDHDLVVDSSCAAELRLLTGSRAIPPYCEPGRGRAWLVSGGEEPVRIVLPSEGDQ
jgi:S-DNA-T family DNA segregation ATPase FtsK/SpoIIIE